MRPFLSLGLLCLLAVALLLPFTAYGTKGERPTKVRGVNAGGWLVLEYFITPSMWANAPEKLEKHDEYSLAKALGPQRGPAYMKKHYSTFITEADFQVMSKLGINVVRVPIGHWAIMKDPPFISESLPYLDKAFEWADKYNMWILVDLHTAPGGQNPWDHSGRVNHYLWHNTTEYRDKTVSVVGQLAARYSKKSNLYGIGILNEPFEVPIPVLLDFTEQAYAAVRKHSQDVYVIVHDSFSYDNFPAKLVLQMKAKKMTNLVLDMHLYTTFGGLPNPTACVGVIDNNYGPNIGNFSKELPVIVGEFSLAMTDGNSPYANYNTVFSDADYQKYWEAQRDAYYEKGQGYFFWNYKLEEKQNEKLPQWSLLEAIARGWIRSGNLEAGELVTDKVEADPCAPKLTGCRGDVLITTKGTCPNEEYMSETYGGSNATLCVSCPSGLEAVFGKGVPHCRNTTDDSLVDICSKTTPSAIFECIVGGKKLKSCIDQCPGAIVVAADGSTISTATPTTQAVAKKQNSGASAPSDVSLGSTLVLLLLPVIGSLYISRSSL